MKIISRREWGVLAFVLAYSFIPSIGGLLRVIELGGGPGIIPENPRALASPVPIVLHAVSSLIFCSVGVIQFLPSLRGRFPALHRAGGRVIALSGVVSALTGLWMTHYFSFPDELQGALLYWTRMFLGALMAGLIVWSVAAIRARNIGAHSAAMLRAYAIGQGASTQTFLGIGWMVSLGSEPLGVERDVMMIFAWLINLLIAELVIRTMFSPRYAAA